MQVLVRERHDLTISPDANSHTLMQIAGELLDFRGPFAPLNYLIHSDGQTRMPI
jgi:hypothetical protein